MEKSNVHQTEMQQIPMGVSRDSPQTVTDPRENQAREMVSSGRQRRKKPFSFHMSLVALNIMNLITALDATTLSVALPVSPCFQGLILQNHAS